MARYYELLSRFPVVVFEDVSSPGGSSQLMVTFMSNGAFSTLQTDTANSEIKISLFSVVDIESRR